MTTNTKLIKASELEEGDTIIIYGEQYIVADIRENGRMDGIWVEYMKDPQYTGAATFYNYDDDVNVML